MEDVLEVYQRRHDPDRPIVCLDETTKQLIRETRVPVPAQPGQPARHDYVRVLIAISNRGSSYWNADPNSLPVIAEVRPPASPR